MSARKPKTKLESLLRKEFDEIQLQDFKTEKQKRADRRHVKALMKREERRIRKEELSKGMKEYEEGEDYGDE